MIEFLPSMLQLPDIMKFADSALHYHQLKNILLLPEILKRDSLKNTLVLPDHWNLKSGATCISISADVIPDNIIVFNLVLADLSHKC